MRLAAEDLYYNGVRLVVGNVLWGIGALVSVYAISRSWIGLLTLLAMVPLSVGLMGMATAIVRERNVVMSDFARPIRGRFWRMVGLGLAELVLIGIAAFDLVLAIQLGGVLGLVLGLVAFYTSLALFVLAFTVWPIVTDPERRDESVRSGVRVAALLVLAHPLRLGLMAVVLAVIGVASIVVAAAIVTVSAAYIALVAAHYVLPAADRLEGRATLLQD
ncbi:MAG: hypothetical protein ACT4OQ_09980 [Chloroflexota bacterium]